MTNINKLGSLIATVLIFVLAAMPLQAQSLTEVELVGIIENMTLNSITVNGLEVDINSAELNTSITLGEIVEVEGVLELDGTIVAREVNGVDEGVQVGEAELIGVLESFLDSTMMVNGQIIDIRPAEVKQGVEVGQMVKVHAHTVAANTWVAREVEPYTPDEDDVDDSSQRQTGEFEFSGTLEQIGQGFVVVSGQTISTEGAEIKNALMVGVRVRLHVRVQNGVMLAREIEYAFGRDDDNSNTNDNSNANANTNSNDNNSNDSNGNTNSNSNDDDDNGNSNTSVDAAITADEAIAIVLSIYPNTTITEIELKTKYGGTLVWEIETSHDIDIDIDAQTGVILSIEVGDNGGNSNSNANNNANGNSNFNSNDNDADDSNSNANFNSNDNDDNSGHDDNDDDDSSGHDDHDDDDNSGSGSRDDDDD